MHRIARTTATVAVALSAALGVTAPAVSAHAAAPVEQRVTEIAHRGASFEKPENTLSAFREGIVDKADMIEIDVQRSSDGVLVVIHDTNLKRTTNVEEVFPDRAPWNVGDFTYAELQQLDAGSWKGAEFAGERIPTLDEVLEAVRKSHSGLLLEVKAPYLYPGIAQQLADAFAAQPGYLKSAVANERLVVQSFDWAFMKEFDSILPQVTTGLLGAPTDAQMVEFATWADQINPHYSAASQAYVDRIHELGMDVNVWTVDKPEDMRRMAENGVDGIISNKPNLLDEVLRDMR